MLLISVLALAMAKGQTPATVGPTVRLGDQEIALNWMESKAFEPTPDLAKWKGWGYLKGGPIRWNADFVQGYSKPDLSDVKPVSTLRLKVIILAQRFGSTGSDPASLLRLSMPQYAIDEELTSIAQDTEYLRATFHGLVRVDADVEVRKTTIYGTGLNQDQDPWIWSRINAYGYEADDKVKRGPFHWVEVRIPGRTYPHLYNSVLERLNELARERGYRVGSGDSPSPEQLKDVLSFKPVNSADFKSHRSITWAAQPMDLSKFAVTSNHSEGVLLSVVDDPERSKILRYTERGYYRTGGMTLPVVGAGFVGHKKLSFWMKSESKDPLQAVLQSGADAQDSVSLLIGGEAPGISSKRIAFRYDGTWQKVSLPLSELKGPVGKISLQAPDSKEKQQIRNPIFFFDDFQFEDDDQPVAYESLKPDLESPNRTMRLAALVAYGSSPTPELRDKAFKLLDDPSDEVRLEAIHVFGKDPAAEPKLIEDVFHIDGFVSQAAIQTLAQGSSELGWAQIRKALAPGTPLRRIAAANALASKKDPMIAGPISGLIGDPDPAVRKAAALAIASLPGDEPPKILSVFFNDVDPDVKSAAIAAASVDDGLIARRVQYLAVNDPWDSVRLAAYLKMAGSKNPDLRKEGWKGVRDDSSLVRAVFLESAPEGPELPTALKSGYGDSHPTVRLAAVKRMAKSSGGTLPVDTSAFKNEYDPRVLAALVDSSGPLQLPADLVDVLRTAQSESH